MNVETCSEYVQVGFWLLEQNFFYSLARWMEIINETV